MSGRHPSGLTVPQANALRALAEANNSCRHGTACHDGVHGSHCPQGGGNPSGAAPRQIARMLWPDSIGWRKVSNRGSTPAGGAMGATMPMKAATVLWRLHGYGLAWHDMTSYDWYVTDRGKRVLAGEETVTR